MKQCSQTLSNGEIICLCVCPCVVFVIALCHWGTLCDCSATICELLFCILCALFFDFKNETYQLNQRRWRTNEPAAFLKIQPRFFLKGPASVTVFYLNSSKGKRNICIASCSLMSPQIFDEPAVFYHCVTSLSLKLDTVGAALHFFTFLILSIFYFPMMSTAMAQGQTSPCTSSNDYDLSWVNIFTWTCLFFVGPAL